MSRHGPLAGAHDMARLHARPRTSSHNWLAERTAVRTTTQVHSRPCTGHAVEGLCHNREFMIR